MYVSLPGTLSRFFFPRASTPQNKEETQSLDFLLPESVKVGDAKMLLV